MSEARELNSIEYIAEGMKARLEKERLKSNHEVITSNAYLSGYSDAYTDLIGYIRDLECMKEDSRSDNSDCKIKKIIEFLEKYKESSYSLIETYSSFRFVNDVAELLGFSLAGRKVCI